MNDKRSFLATLLAGAAWASPAGRLLAQPGAASGPAALPPFDGATAWLNSPPLTPAALRGKVVLVEFWTYSCINWRREYPYVRAWAAKYKDQDLVVVGVHSPEFGFEKDLDNVRRAVKDIGVAHPVAVDSDHAVWRAFENDAWPARYFFDARGRLRHRRYGEGEYALSERLIQQLLAEAGATSVARDLVDPAASGPEAPPDWESLRSPETYLGYARATSLASRGALRDKRRGYEAPARLRLNQWALGGEWTWQAEAAVLDAANGRIACSFHARDLHLVMGPATRGAPVPFRVSIDGQPPGPARGVDVDAQGLGMLAEHRMYQLIRQTGPIADRRFEIAFLQAGAQAFSFTFG